MRIRLTISVAAADWSHIPGDVVDWPNDAARAYLAAGYAEPVEDAPSADTPAAPRARKAR